jgi:hypothetical protein
VYTAVFGSTSSIFTVIVNPRGETGNLGGWDAARIEPLSFFVSHALQITCDHYHAIIGRPYGYAPRHALPAGGRPVTLIGCGPKVPSDDQVTLQSAWSVI